MPDSTARITGPRHWPAWIGLGLLRAVGALPLPVIAWLGHRLGDLFYYLLRSRRRVAETNIARCFPELDRRAQALLVRAHFRGFGQALLDLGLAWWSSPARLRRLVRLTGREHVDRALAEGRNLILLAPHFLALEVAGTRISLDWPLVAVFRDPDNAVFRQSVSRARRRFGAKLVERNQNLTAMVRQLRKGVPLYYLPDQSTGRKRSVFVPFFGVQAATFSALGRLAALGEAVVVPCYSRQLARGAGYEIVFAPPLADFPTGDPVEDTRRMNVAIEEAVRAAPEQYFWIHKRFKTRPRGEPKFYSD
ncbi:lipid A biosynthesis acyltransferase [Sulfurifustis variabilis]|uniref:Lipid A biosynthesis acyltransferase n=1 Tax=Sulfurifustis variabilis TaxID=1675686 RepID=A0A1B4V096_9GAMM|nr:lipid A biosynthesis acyltransferase [Sulfurifustis variabilis]BAU46595.1 lipid A biosynthesis acyltransferase [Sulfurifustis variabilis]